MGGKASPAAQARGTKKFKDKMRRRVNAMKASPCVDCSQVYEHFAMDFDHLKKSEKLYPVSAMLARHWSFDKIEREVAKCDLVCVLCHRRRTYLRREVVGVQNVQQERRRRGKRLIDSMKDGRPCSDCGKVFETYQMDFDHREGVSKVDGVSRMVGHSEETILREIAKCDLVCALCHRRRTNLRAQYGDGNRREYEDLTIRCDLPGREVARLYVEGAHMRELAKKYGVSPPTVRKFLVAEGVRLRSISEAKRMAFARAREK